jgi:hypothetical protein
LKDYRIEDQGSNNTLRNSDRLFACRNLRHSKRSGAFEGVLKERTMLSRNSPELVMYELNGSYFSDWKREDTGK